MNGRSVPLLLLLLAAFLAPIGGGQIALDSLPLLNSSDALASLWGAPETPVLAHAILAMLPSLALAFLLFQRKIIQVPNNTISALMLIFFGLLLATVGYSSYKSTSLLGAVEWITYGVAFYAVVAAVGRQRGPQEIIAALTLGCTVVALRGILEYAETVAKDPTWRIFAGWVNPNATAAILLIGFFCAMGLVLSSPQRMAAAWGVAAALNGGALLLTQSKGGLLALLIGLIAIGVLATTWLMDLGLDRLKPALGRIFALLLVMLMGGLLLSVLTRSPSGGVLSRVTEAGATAEQSAGFRANLWKGAIAMVKERPVGYGIGTFRYESSRPGLTPQTHLAHQSYLQLAAEASPVALILFLSIAAIWFYHTLRGVRTMPWQQNMLRAGVIAAVVAIGAHSFIDSDFSYYGIGYSTFMLLGVGMLLSVDAVAPENMPAPIRKSAGLGIMFLAVVFVFFGMTDVLKAQMRGALVTRDREQAKRLRPLLKSYGNSDAEAWGLMAQAPESMEDRRQSLMNAVAFGPTPRNLRALARLQVEAGQLPEALSTLQKALLHDPNNLLALLQLARLQDTMGDAPGALQTYRRLIEVEQKPYFTIRAIPELVPTETYEARIEVAKRSEAERDKVALLEPAVAGLVRYRETTVPKVVQMATAGESFSGESIDTAKRKMELGAAAAQELSALYRELGNAAKAADAEAEAGRFLAAASKSK